MGENKHGCGLSYLAPSDMLLLLASMFCVNIQQAFTSFAHTFAELNDRPIPVLNLLPLNFVFAAVFVYTVVKFCKRLHNSYRVHV